ncbi:MAG: hypothetical protein ABEI52_06440, partial [Halobacteriaceae archaeon]
DMDVLVVDRDRVGSDELLEWVRSADCPTPRIPIVVIGDRFPRNVTQLPYDAVVDEDVDTEEAREVIDECQSVGAYLSAVSVFYEEVQKQADSTQVLDSMSSRSLLNARDAADARLEEIVNREDILSALFWTPN